MHEHGKSDNLVVPAKPPNNAGGPVAEVVEERRLAEGNTDDPTRAGRSAGQGVPSGLDRVREVARKDKEARFTALLHHVDLARLWAAYVAINPKAAPGVDEVTWDATARTFERTSKTCSVVSTAVPIGRALLVGCTYRNRTDANVRSASPPWRTRSSNVRWWRC